MKFTAIFTVIAATLSSLASAQVAGVSNLCNFTVYLQSFPYNGGTPNSFTTLKPGARPYFETYVQGGSTIKMSNSRSLASPLFFGYTYSNTSTDIYYSLNSNYGNPFIGYDNKIKPNKPQCPRYNCGAGDTGCYDRVLACTNPVNLVTQLCVK